MGRQSSQRMTMLTPTSLGTGSQPPPAEERKTDTHPVLLPEEDPVREARAPSYRTGPSWMRPMKMPSLRSHFTHQGRETLMEVKSAHGSQKTRKPVKPPLVIGYPLQTPLAKVQPPLAIIAMPPRANAQTLWPPLANIHNLLPPVAKVGPVSPPLAQAYPMKPPLAAAPPHP